MNAQRTIAARLLTDAGWVQGSFHLPGHVSLVDFLDHGGPFLRLTEATLPRLGKPVEQFFLQKNGAFLVVGTGPEEELKLKTPPANTTTHRVSCLITDGYVTGNLELLSHLKVSEHVMHHPHFFVMRDCVVGHDGAKEERVPLLLLNGTRIVGVSDVA